MDPDRLILSRPASQVASYGVAAPIEKDHSWNGFPFVASPKPQFLQDVAIGISEDRYRQFKFSFQPSVFRRRLIRQGSDVFLRRTPQESVIESDELFRADRAP